MRRRAYGLIRVSGKKQEAGMSLPEQTLTIQRLCSDQGWELVQVFADVKSGETEIAQRIGLAECLTAVKHDEGSVIVVACVDRLARDLIIQETLIRMVERYGGAVASAKPEESSLINGESTDPTRTMIRQILGAVSQYERATIAARMNAARLAKGRRGGFTGGPVPFGYRKVGKAKDSRLVPDPEQQETVLVLCDWHQQGKTLRWIAETANEMGYVGPGGRQWDFTSVRRTIQFHRQLAG